MHKKEEWLLNSVNKTSSIDLWKLLGPTYRYCRNIEDAKTWIQFAVANCVIESLFDWLIDWLIVSNDTSPSCCYTWLFDCRWSRTCSTVSVSCSTGSVPPSCHCQDVLGGPVPSTTPSYARRVPWTSAVRHSTSHRSLLELSCPPTYFKGIRLHAHFFDQKLLRDHHFNSKNTSQ